MTGSLGARAWLPEVVNRRVTQAQQQVDADPWSTLTALDRLVEQSHRIHDVQCLNLNPATNVMNPRAEAMLARGLGTRASLGQPGDKYEVGLESIEQIEVIAAELAARVFGAPYAEVRVGSGALANLYAFMATCAPGDRIIAPPATIGGHVTHHAAGAAGLYGLQTLDAPVDAGRFTVDLDALRAATAHARPRLITIGGSLNLRPHPVADIRAIADEVGAKVLFDAAHVCGVIAGGQWPNPLDEGAHLMTMSTYKSLGGPPGGLVLTRDAELAERLDRIAYPGLTANSDPGRIAALAVTLLDWTVAGAAYADQMVASAQVLAAELLNRGVPVLQTVDGPTRAHQLAIAAAAYGGGQRAARALRADAHLLTCGIGLPLAPVPGDLNGLRIGTPEAVRIGMTTDDMPQLANLLARGLAGDGSVAAEVTEWRSGFTGVHYTLDSPAP
ncbi:serine hydroxymethyltransferase [Blastococcus sp. Marseille-P5729]|uniref:serine hydroxymethyltransferase n=1 Tax=Blastococcus sp. Marseille-P5729 TaxID=2086582 RepID=UPI000D0FEDD8|nr:aminotransferase class I/II-fold pyridoxal phosphate-dependent enzyme [Blastococcus sp. Marseille-P5729]